MSVRGGVLIADGLLLSLLLLRRWTLVDTHFAKSDLSTGLVALPRGREHLVAGYRTTAGLGVAATTASAGHHVPGSRGFAREIGERGRTSDFAG